MQIMRIEKKPRGCGLRKKGGLYMFFSMENVRVCTSLPLPLPGRCPVCGEEIEFFRSVKVIDPRKFFKEVEHKCGPSCPVCNPPEKGAVIWVGKQFYSVSSFMAEAMSMGISKRISTIPKGLKPGDVVYFLHKEAIAPTPEDNKAHPGVFLAARLSAFHKIIDDEKAQDQNLMKEMEDQGITPVIEYDAKPAEGQEMAEGDTEYLTDRSPSLDAFNEKETMGAEGGA